MELLLGMVVGPRGRLLLAHYLLHYLGEMTMRNYPPLLYWMDRRKLNYRLEFESWQEASEWSVTMWQ